MIDQTAEKHTVDINVDIVTMITVCAFGHCVHFALWD